MPTNVCIMLTESKGLPFWLNEPSLTNYPFPAEIKPKTLSSSRAVDGSDLNSTPETPSIMCKLE